MTNPSSHKAFFVAVLLVASMTIQSFPVARAAVLLAKVPPAEKTPSSPEPPQSLERAALPARTPDAPQVVTISATDNDTFPDPNSDGHVQAGETITYNVTITNSGDTDALDVVYNDTIDFHTSTLVPASGTLVFRNNADTYAAIGNVGINTDNIAGPGQSVVDNDTPNGASISGFGNSLATANGTLPNGGNIVTTANNGKVTMDPDGSFKYDPAAGFVGADSFFYTLSKPTATGIAASSARVTINVSGMIWFVNAAAGAGGNGTLVSPFNCLVGAGCFEPTANDAPGDIIFLYNGSYTGGLLLQNNQKIIGQGASASLATISGLTISPASESLPATNSIPGNVTVTTVAAAMEGLGLAQDNTLRGFTIANTTGAKISGSGFGTLTVGDSTAPDMVLSGNGQALNLTNGTFAATSAFSGVSSVSSAGTGITLIQVAGTVSLGSTVVSDSTTQAILVNQCTVDVNFGNTIVGTPTAGSGGTNAVSLQNNSSGTRTFGTLTIRNNNGPANSAFLHAVGGGNTVVGTTNISNVTGSGHGIDIQGLAAGTSVTFGDTIVNGSSSGALVNLGGAGVENAGDVTFLSLGGTNINGSGLVGAENTGTITVTNPSATNLFAANGAAIDITKSAAPATPISLHFGAVSSINSPTTGVNLDRVSGDLTIGTTSVSTPAGVGISVQNTSPGGTMNFGNAASDASGNDGVFLNANGADTIFVALNINPNPGVRAFHATNNTGTTFSSSGTIGPMTAAEAIDVTSSPLNMVLTSVTTDNTGDSDSCVTLTNTSGTLVMNGGTLTGGTAAAFRVDAGSVSTTFSGDITQASDAPTVLVLDDHNGTLTFNTGSVNATDGTGLRFDDADGVYNFTGTNTLNGGDAGIDILNDSTGSFNFSSNTSITDPSGPAFVINDSNVDGTYSGSISDSTGFAVDIDDHDSGTYTFDTGQINSTGKGIRVANCNGGTVNFNSPTKNLNTDTHQAVTLDTNNAGGRVNFGNGGLNINTTSGNGFSATGGGSVTVTTGADPNTIETTTGIALIVIGTTIGGANMTFRSIASNGAPNGIFLDTTGALGGLVVTGDGGDCTFATPTCSGGRITATVGADDTPAGVGVYLKDTRDVSLNLMRIDNHPNFAIRGHNVHGFTLYSSVIDGDNGTSATADSDIVNGEDSIRMINLTGSAQIEDCFIGGGYEQNLRIVNDSGILDRFTIRNNSIGDLDGAGPGRGVDNTDGDDDVNVEARNAGTVMNVTLLNNVLNNARGDVIETNAMLGATMDVLFRFNQVSNNHPNRVVGGGGSTFTGLGAVTYDISCNSFRDSNGIGLNLFRGRPADGTAGGDWSGTIFNNTVGVTGVPNSGAADGASGIAVEVQGNGTHTTLIKNNVVWNHGQAGIRVNVVDANTVAPMSVTMNATVVGNLVAEPDNPNGLAGVLVVQGAVPVADANTTVNLRLGSVAVADEKNALNDASGLTNDVFLQRAAGPIGVFNLSRAGSASATATQVVIDDNIVDGPSVSTDAGITLVNPDPALPAAVDETCTPPPVADFIDREIPGVRSVLSEIRNNAPRVETAVAAPSRSTSEHNTSDPVISSLALLRATAKPVGQPLAVPPVIQPLFERASRVAERRTKVTGRAATIGPVSIGSVRSSVNRSREALFNHAQAQTGVGSQPVREGLSRDVHLNRAFQSRGTSATVKESPNPQKSKPKPNTPSFGGQVTINVGTIPAFSSVTIVYQVTVNSSAPTGANYVRDQGTVSGSNFSNVLTFDPNPNPPGTTPPPNPTLETRTPLVHPTASGSLISGILTDSDGAPVGGVVLQLTGGRRTITRADGKYQFEDVPTNEFYTLTPLLANHHFTPASRSFSLTGSTTDADFGAEANTTQDANPLDTDMYFVRQQYLDILGREPDESGLQYWTTQVNGTCAAGDTQCLNARRIDVAAAFFIALEFQQSGSFIYDVYSGSLGRRPFYLEYAADRQQVIGGANLDEEKDAFARAFVQRPEFVAKYRAVTTAELFVDALIQNVQLVSGVDLNSERGALIARYATGLDQIEARGFVVRDVADNAAFRQSQYNKAFVLTEYFGYLRRDPEPGGYAFWLDVLNNGAPGNYRGMVCAFMTSAEYQARFSTVVTHTNNECSGP